MNWLAMLMGALDEAHGDHDEGCDCYERLADAVREGIYRFPAAPYDVPGAPVYGCESPFQYAMRRTVEQMQDRIYRSVYIDTAMMMGLSETVSR